MVDRHFRNDPMMEPSDRVARIAAEVRRLTPGQDPPEYRVSAAVVDVMTGRLINELAQELWPYVAEKQLDRLRLTNGIVVILETTMDAPFGEA